MSDDCIFCKIVDGDIPSEKVYEDDDIIAFKDANPAAPTHLLVIPREHIVNLKDAGDEHAELIGRLNLVAAQVAEDAGLSDFRLAQNNGAGAGQSVFHIHYHVLGGRELSWPPG
ncbi:MAG: histidine triad nucleotide-binding protein [Myxococcota bacterium]